MVRRPRIIAAAATLLCMLPAVTGRAQEAHGVQAPARTAQDLKRLSIEELAEIDVTSVSRRSERLSQTAAAISVVPGEDIRRSGYTTLADAMRLADALDVARVNSSTWAVSARGFNTNPANKLLVLIDGRSVYSPLSSGTFWDAQDLVLPDIERIEVIRGPGGSIWGANAVNGVINVITKEASATRGTLVGLASGNDEHVVGVVRHGGRLGADGSYRVYGKFRRRGEQLLATGEDASDAVQMGQGGFRIESGAQDAARWFLQADLYRGTQGFPDRPDGDTFGGNVLGRWTRRWSAASEFQFQAYYDGTSRRVPLQFEEQRHTVDLDVQHAWQARGRHNLIAGGGVRATRGDDLGVAGFFFDPQVRTSTLLNFFAQDEIRLGRDLFLTVGSKVERNDFTGLELQPTGRMRWSPTATQTLWGAASRAVRLPTRFDTDLRLINPLTRVVTLEGHEDFESETVVAYEAGYRVRPHPLVAIDVAAFVNRYDDLRSTELTFRPHPVIVLMNRLNADTAGVEIGGTVQPAEPWQLHGSYAYFHKDLSFDEGSRDVYGGTVEGNDPAHLFLLRSNLDLPHGLAFDVLVRHTSRRPDPQVPAYTELDGRLAWTVQPGWEVALVGQHLLEPSHPELFTPGGPRFTFRRGVYLRSAWRF
jgi:iron complex outermembrane receptor protein